MPEQHDFNNETSRTIGRMESKLDNIIDNQKEFHDRYEKIEREVKDANIRISRVENKIHWYSGATAAAFTILTFFGDSIRALFR